MVACSQLWPKKVRSCQWALTISVAGAVGQREHIPGCQSFLHAFSHKNPSHERTRRSCAVSLSIGLPPNSLTLFHASNSAAKSESHHCQRLGSGLCPTKGCNRHAHHVGQLGSVAVRRALHLAPNNACALRPLHIHAHRWVFQNVSACLAHAQSSKLFGFCVS